VSATHQPIRPSPELFFDVIRRSDDAAALKTAIELDLFTAMGEGNQTVPALANQCQASQRGVRILCDVLVLIGFLTKSKNAYALTQDSAMFLDRRSPSYIGGAARFLTLHRHRQAHDLLTEAVRKGGTALSEEGSLKPENPDWVEFARGMAPTTRVPAESIAELLNARAAQPWRVLDIAASHGLFGITLAQHNPNADITAVDWPNVLEVAKENARQAGVGSRYHLRPGSALEMDFGGGFDVVLITNFLHHFDLQTNEALLRKFHAALLPGGRAVILEFVPDEERISPPAAAKFSLTMLATTPSGDAYTFSEYERILRSAGFRSAKMYPIPSDAQQIILAVK
jgi:2-polyprenyl-3-methyl-5-hydroxy-6-metoxy-1,4-benzoquinol methylase